MSKTFSQILSEETLSSQKIKDVFRDAEDTANKSGENRTRVGRAKDRTINFLKNMDETSAADASKVWYSQRLANILGVKSPGGVKLSEGGIKDLFRAAGRGAEWLKSRGRDLTRTVTYKKLVDRWEAAGHPSDSEDVARLLRSAGLSDEMVNQIYHRQNIGVGVDTRGLGSGEENDTSDRPAQAVFRDITNTLTGSKPHGGQFTGGEPTGEFETTGGDRYRSYPDGTTTRVTSGTGSRTRTQRTLFVSPGVAKTLSSDQPAILTRTQTGAEISTGGQTITGTHHMKPGLVPLEFWGGKRGDDGSLTYTTWRVGTPVKPSETKDFRDELRSAGVKSSKTPMDTGELSHGSPTVSAKPSVKSPERNDFEARLRAARGKQPSMTPNAIRKREARAKARGERDGK